MTEYNLHGLLPPLPAGQGRGGVLLILSAYRRNPLPTSPCKQGEGENETGT